MVTGNNLTDVKTVSSEYFDLTFSDEPATNYVLLLEVTSSSVKACWYHKSKNLITGFAHYPIDSRTDDFGLEALLANHPYLNSDFDQIIISIVAENYQLLPSNIGITADKALFQLTNKNLSDKAELLGYNLISGHTSIMYEASEKLISSLEKLFPKNILIPHVAPRIEHGQVKLKKSILTDRLCAHIEDGFISILAFKNRQLTLANTFYQTGKEDIAYYILYVAEIIDFDSQKTDLVLSGDFEIGDEKWNILNAYWKRIKIAEPIDGVDISSKLHDRSTPEFDYLTQHLLCA